MQLEHDSEFKGVDQKVPSSISFAAPSSSSSDALALLERAYRDGPATPEPSNAIDSDSDDDSDDYRPERKLMVPGVSEDLKIDIDQLCKRFQEANVDESAAYKILRERVNSTDPYQIKDENPSRPELFLKAMAERAFVMATHRRDTQVITYASAETGMVQIIHSNAINATEFITRLEQDCKLDYNRSVFDSGKRAIELYLQAPGPWAPAGDRNNNKSRGVKRQADSSNSLSDTVQAAIRDVFRGFAAHSASPDFQECSEPLECVCLNIARRINDIFILHGCMRARVYAALPGAVNVVYAIGDAPQRKDNELQPNMGFGTIPFQAIKDIIQELKRYDAMPMVTVEVKDIRHIAVTVDMFALNRHVWNHRKAAAKKNKHPAVKQNLPNDSQE